MQEKTFLLFWLPATVNVTAEVCRGEILEQSAAVEGDLKTKQKQKKKTL